MLGGDSCSKHPIPVIFAVVRTVLNGEHQSFIHRIIVDNRGDFMDRSFRSRVRLTLVIGAKCLEFAEHCGT